ncbi:alpha/beta hydrolase [Sphingobacterium multivorum]|uniref:alpha/beta hydrolase n=1 Tax=Sphingobacterium multivorum TaxID=28454 RepID=UPI002FDA6547
MKMLKLILHITLQIVFIPALLLIVYLGLIYLTDGFGKGLLAGALSILATLVLVFLIYKKTKRFKTRLIFVSSLIPGVIFVIFVVYTLIPVASSGNISKIAEVKRVEVRYWNLKTGSKIAYFKLSANPRVIKKTAPIIFLHGGPGAYVRQIDINFFKLFTEEGYDVYLYDQAGSGRSSLIPKKEYSDERNIMDFDAIINIINAKKYIVVGQSYGGSLLAHIMAKENLSKRIYKAIYAEPGLSVASNLTDDEKIFSKSHQAPTGDINLPVRLLISLMISPRGEFTSQNEIINYVVDHEKLIQGLFAESFPQKDAKRIPKVEIGVINFAANSIIKLNDLKSPKDLYESYQKCHVPSLLILGESSYIERNAPMDLLRINNNITRVQYIKGVGHILWNGLDGNNLVVKKVIDDFLNNRESNIPNYPQRSQISVFLKQRL